MLLNNTKTPASLNTNASASSVGTTPPVKQKKKLNLRAILTVVGLSLFFVVAMSAVMIAQRQKQVDAPVAPTSPVSKPSANDPALTCNLGFTVGVERKDACEDLELFVDGKKVNATKANPALVSEKSQVQAKVLPKTGLNLSSYNSWVWLYNTDNQINPNDAEQNDFVHLCTPLSTVSTQQADCPNGYMMAKYAPAPNSTDNLIGIPIPELYQFVDYKNPENTNITNIQINGYLSDGSGNWWSSSSTACLMYLKLQDRESIACKNVSLEIKSEDGTLTPVTGRGTKAEPIEVLPTDTVNYKITATEADASFNYWAALYNPDVLADADPRSVTGLCRPGSGLQGDWCIKDGLEGASIFASQKTSNIIPLDVNTIFAYTTGGKNGNFDGTTPDIIQVNAYIGNSDYSSFSRPVPACVAYLTQVEPVVPGVATCTSKKAYTDYSAVSGSTLIPTTTKLEKGQEFVYRVTVNAKDGETSGVVTLVDTLNSNLDFIPASDETPPSGAIVIYDSTTRKVSATLGKLGATGKTSVVVEFKVKVKSTATAGATIKNTATISTPVTGSTPVAKECSVTHTIKSDLPDYSCNKPCTTTAQCQTVAQGGNALYSCFGTEGSKTCRLTSNTSSTTCEPAKTVSTPTPTPTPAIGCNDKCNTNADCSNPAHVCYDTTLIGQTYGKVCRLANYVESTSCTTPTVASNPSSPTQPSLPAALPQTGPEDWLNWMKAGLVTLGVGAALLLLL